MLDGVFGLHAEGWTMQAWDTWLACTIRVSLCAHRAIVLDCGCSDARHFATSFRKHADMTPSAVRWSRLP